MSDDPTWGPLRIVLREELSADWAFHPECDQHPDWTAGWVEPVDFTDEWGAPDTHDASIHAIALLQEHLADHTDSEAETLGNALPECVPLPCHPWVKVTCGCRYPGGTLPLRP